MLQSYFDKILSRVDLAVNFTAKRYKSASTARFSNGVLPLYLGPARRLLSPDPSVVKTAARPDFTKVVVHSMQFAWPSKVAPATLAVIKWTTGCRQSGAASAAGCLETLNWRRHRRRAVPHRGAASPRHQSTTTKCSAFRETPASRTSRKRQYHFRPR